MIIQMNWLKNKHVFSEHEEYILMRIRNVCKGGVDAVIDFVSSARTVKRSVNVLREVRRSFVPVYTC